MYWLHSDVLTFGGMWENSTFTLRNALREHRHMVHSEEMTVFLIYSLSLLFALLFAMKLLDLRHQPLSCPTPLQDSLGEMRTIISHLPALLGCWREPPYHLLWIISFCSKTTLLLVSVVVCCCKLYKYHICGPVWWLGASFVCSQCCVRCHVKGML